MNNSQIVCVYVQTNPFVQSVQILICQEIFTEAVKIINRDGFCNDLGEKVTINHGINRGDFHARLG